MPAAMRRWWKVAMLHRAPAAAQRRANASAGSSLVSVEELLVVVDGTR
ncbi:hypothetical protein ACFV8T_35075 [Streptomyces sp. NPDC059832]